MDFTIVPAASQDIDTVIGLIRQVYAQMAQKEWYALDNADFTRAVLESGQGCAYFAVEALTNRIAGAFMAAFPGLSCENLGRDIGLPQEALPLVAHMDSAVVLPEFRGQGLQRRLMSFAEGPLRARGYRYLMCTVHPDNRFSKGNALALGYRVMATKEKYGGYLRDILLKELPEEP